MRATIAALVNDNFFGTLKRLCAEAGVVFSAEAVAPTMVSDGLRHHGVVDLPMGEFWLRSPTHDKPNDILDAVSGGRVYGRNIIQAEAFTQLRMAWDEHPGMLKALGDRNLALGVNRLVFHVFTHNPWTDRRPGMTLDGVGLYFQRDQTWWLPGRAWLDYLGRCQALLQLGRPRADVAVFTGGELPSRAVLPDRLTGALPGLIGPERLAAHAARLRNADQPLRELPKGVRSAANMEDPADWIDPLSGYAYDSVNLDALLRLASVKEGRLRLPGGGEYALLVLPGARRMDPQGDRMGAALVRKLYQLVHDGATVLIARRPGLAETDQADPEARALLSRLWGAEPVAPIGAGRVLRGPWTATSLDPLGIAPALTIRDHAGEPTRAIAWCERELPDASLFFLSNQAGGHRRVDASFREEGRVPELFDPLTGECGFVPQWRQSDGRTSLTLELAPAQSVFVVFRKPADTPAGGAPPPAFNEFKRIDGPWSVTFAAENGGPAEPLSLAAPADWTAHPDPRVRHYAGTAVYEAAFDLPAAALPDGARIFLDPGTVHNLAEVIVNGLPCGVAWTQPLRVEVTPALRPGRNTLQLRVTNTWANRLIGDHALPEAARLTWTTAPYRLDGEPLLPAGLSGPVILLQSAPNP